ncbi:MAG: hypothetical protein NZM11_11000 [Anaerolineales bacterium]|nr:hypothetical protein [Anaerolineales bacterium]MDW8325475.1 hypothetical protein [Anaerolineales bacterium]
MSTLVRLTGKALGIVVLAVLAGVLGLSALTYIQPAAAATATDTLAHRGGGRGGFCGEAGLTAAAKALNMTVDELRTQLWGGATLSQLAEKAGVDLQDVRDAVTAACVAQVRTAIEQAVTNGTLTRAHADWLLEGLDKGYWGPAAERPFGFFGFGPRGFGKFGRFGAPPANVTPTPGSNS